MKHEIGSTHWGLVWHRADAGGGCCLECLGPVDGPELESREGWPGGGWCVTCIHMPWGSASAHSKAPLVNGSRREVGVRNLFWGGGVPRAKVEDAVSDNLSAAVKVGDGGGAPGSWRGNERERVGG